MAIGHDVVGSGAEKVLALHGWLSDRRVYDFMMPFMDQARHTLARMDFRGYGASENVSGDHSVEEIADDALALADSLDWERFHIVGHSMGGMAAQRIALKAPGRIKSIVAITPVPASGFALDADADAFFRSSADSDEALAGIYNTLTGEQHTQSILQELVARTRAATSRAAYIGYLDAWTKTDFAADVASVDCPVLVIAGAHDGALGPDVMRDTYLKQLPDVRMEVIESAGHYPMLETPLELIRRLEGFLSPHE